jgi:aminoglycoside phosphotransferase
VSERRTVHGGLLQDPCFVVPELVGAQLEQLFVRFYDKPAESETEHGALHEISYTADGALFWLKPKGGHWHRFFMDAGYVQVEEFASDDELIRDELEEFPADPGGVDLGARHSLIGGMIASFTAADRDDVALAHFTLRFTDGRELVHAWAVAGDFDSPVIVSVRLGGWPAPRFKPHYDWYGKEPSEDDATDIARKYRAGDLLSVTRFTTGLAHWVYDVRYADGASIVVRLTKAKYRHAFEGAVHWSKVLRPLSVPLPELLEHGEHRRLPYLILERLPGEDLGVVYEKLSSTERAAIASEVCRVQQLVATLPEGTGYGSVNLPDGPQHPTWRSFLGELLTQSAQRIEAARAIGTEVVDRVAQAAGPLQGYFDAVRPTPFLDDATTKNVLVHEGRFSGIVDVDELGFGDPLLTIGLTRASLLAAGRDCEYTDFWSDALAVSEQQRKALRFYTALFLVVFMSEQGQRFNRDIVPPDHVVLARLHALLDAELRSLLDQFEVDWPA